MGKKGELQKKISSSKDIQNNKRRSDGGEKREEK
jgi:hypothetical protein